MKALFTKGHGGVLVPASFDASAFMEKVKLGGDVWAEFTKARNARFHKKFFTLLDLAFQTWEPAEGVMEYRGRPIEKNKERFRAEILILAGHYDAVYSVKGDVRLVAKSISFAALDDIEFDKVYRQVLDVVWRQVMQHSRYRSAKEVDDMVARLMSYE